MTTLAALCEQHAPASFEFLKVDVEGAEPTCCAAPTGRASGPRSSSSRRSSRFSLAPAWDEWEPLLMARTATLTLWSTSSTATTSPRKHAALGRLLRSRADVVRRRPQIRNFKPAPTDRTHPDHRLARRCSAGADMAQLPLHRPRRLLRHCSPAMSCSRSRPAGQRGRHRRGRSSGCSGLCDAVGSRLALRAARLDFARFTPRFIDFDAFRAPAAASRRAMRGNSPSQSTLAPVRLQLASFGLPLACAIRYRP